jgi:dTMP kinase
VDGAGTTTQVDRIARALRAEGHAVLTTREPSDGPIGTLIRQALTRRLVLPGGTPLAQDTLALLYAADRTDHLHSRVLPALAAGQVVLSDRYVHSSLAYQGLDLPMAWVEEINARAPAPGLTLFVEVSPEEAARRRAARGGVAELFDDEALQRRITRQYELALELRQARGEPVVRLDGHLPVEVVTERALAVIQPLLAGSPPVGGA